MKLIFRIVLLLLLLLPRLATADVIVANAVTSKCFRVFVNDSSVGTGVGLAGLAFNTASLVCYYSEEGQGGATSITLQTSTLGTYTSGAFKEVDATNMKGWYEFCPPNAALDTGVGKATTFQCSGAANMAPMNLRVQLSPSVVAEVVNDKTGYALSQAFPANFSALAITGGGAVTAGTVSDKTGYSLTQAFPSNFSSLAITGGGAVTAGTVSDKTGYTVSTVSDKTGYSLTQAFPSNFSSLAITGGGAVTAGTVSDKTGYSLVQAFPSNFSALAITAGGAVTAGSFGAGTITTASIADGAITAAKFGSDVLRIGTAQSVAASTIQLAASETYADDELSDNHSVLILSATTGRWQNRCICDNVNATDTVTLCAPWKTTPTGTIVYSVIPTPNCNPAKWPLTH